RRVLLAAAYRHSTVFLRGESARTGCLSCVKSFQMRVFVVFAAQEYINCCRSVRPKRTLSPQSTPTPLTRRIFMSNSYFPRWRKVHGGTSGIVVQPDERMSWPQNVAMGAQHVVAMFGSTILAPLLMGFDANVAILMSGVGTLIFFGFRSEE